MRKSPEQLAIMRKAGRVVAEMHDKIRAAIKPGVTTKQLDKIGREVIEKRGAKSNFLNYHGFPAVICASPNDMIVHGIPGSYRLAEGDIISIDCGAIIDGWHGDAAFTAPVGEISKVAKKLLQVTEASLFAGIDQMVAGNRIGDIGHAVQSHVEAAGFSVVRDLVGHGIGRQLHEDPQVPNYGRPGRGLKLTVGQVLAIEPMVNVGRPDVYTKGDGWTVVTRDGRRSAHFEHTIAVGRTTPEILSTSPRSV